MNMYVFILSLVTCVCVCTSHGAERHAVQLLCMRERERDVQYIPYTEENGIRCRCWVFAPSSSSLKDWVQTQH
jgi:hypothetical protein